MQQLLWKTLVEMTSCMDGTDVGMQFTSIEFDLPIEVSLMRNTGEKVDFFAELPSWRWRTAFDHKPARLRVSAVLMSEQLKTEPEGGSP